MPHYFLPAGGPLKQGKHFIFEVNKTKFKELKTKQGLLHFAFTLNLQEEGFHVDFQTEKKKKPLLWRNQVLNKSVDSNVM